MRKPVIAGMILFAFVTMASTSKASALDPSKLLVIEKQLTNSSSIVLKDKESDKAEPAAEEKKTEPEVTNYTVAEGDSLSKIAQKFNTTWERLFDKNTNVEQPDVIKVNDVITIPKEDEKLEARPRPVAAPAPSQPVNSPKPATSKPAPATASTAARGSSAGNTYGYGYCTWYVKNRRPDLPNNLGNADTWVARAAAQGIPTGAAPRAGAVGQAGMHVVYVESVNGDGTVNISEMNHVGWNVQNSRTVPASSFYYIY